MRAAAYLAVAIALVGFGALGIFSIGAPFLLTGVLMLGFFGRRSHAEVIVPALLWPWVFTFVYVLVGPLGCTSTSIEAPGEAITGMFTTCTNVLGIDYSGPGAYSPPLWPAVLAAGAVATGASLAVRSQLRRPASAPAK